jgi:hypothetical protein
MRFRAEHLRPHGWRPLQTLQNPDWCGARPSFSRAHGRRLMVAGADLDSGSDGQSPATAGVDGGDDEEPSEAFTWSTSCPMSLRHANRSARSAHASTVPSTCSVRAGTPGVAATSWRSRAIHVWSGCS